MIIKGAADLGRRSAAFSTDRRDRYWLTRTWPISMAADVSDDHRPLAFLGLNPSTADAFTDDPTIRRCVNFSKREGAGGLVMVNLSAMRSTDPKALYALLKKGTGVQQTHRAFAPEAFPAMLEAIAGCAGVVACFGNFAGAGANARARLGAEARLVYQAIVGRGLPVWCLGTTQDGWPRHPLYLRNDARLELWTPPTESA